MMRRGWTVLVGAVVLLLLSFGLSWLPVPYVALGPGPTVDTLGTVKGKDVIAIGGGAVSTSKGNLNLTTVSVRDGLDLGSALRLWVDDTNAVVPRELIYPPGRSDKQVERENTEQFKSSQSTAETAALAALGYPMRVAVGALPSGSASAGKLEKGDVIVAVDGKPVTSSRTVVEQVRAHKPGEQVTVEYTRGGKAGSATITTRKAPDGDHAAIGVQLEQEQDHPYKITFQVGQDIGGPSAGLMFALAIVDKLTPEDLTGGLFIAGTGEITDDGVVGAIGGVPQKMVAAKRAGATVFLTPAANCTEARRTAPKGLRLVKVEKLTDALRSLEKLREGKAGDAPSC